MATAFQADAFQNNAFQISGGGTSITLAQASWVWTGFPTTVDAINNLILAQASWIWTGFPVVLDIKTMITLARGSWFWFAQPIQGNFGPGTTGYNLKGMILSVGRLLGSQRVG